MLHLLHNTREVIFSSFLKMMKILCKNVEEKDGKKEEKMLTTENIEYISMITHVTITAKSKV